MENVDRLVIGCLESRKNDLRIWGKQLAVAVRFDFGNYDDLPKISNGAELLSCVDKYQKSLQLPARNCLFYCNDHIFCHAVDGEFIKVRMAYFDAGEDGLYFSPTALQVNFLEGKIIPIQLPGGPKQDKRGALEDVAILLPGFLDFLIRLKLSPEKVRNIDVRERSVTLVELSAVMGIPVRELQRRAKREKWQYTVA
jgi:hypothetical protein